MIEDGLSSIAMLISECPNIEEVRATHTNSTQQCRQLCLTAAKLKKRKIDLHLL